MDPVIVFSLILMLGALGVAAFMVIKSLKDTKREIETARRHCEKLSRMLRTVARESLRLRHALLDETARDERLRTECETIEQAIAEFRQHAAPLVVLDERKALGDVLWQVPVGRVSGNPDRAVAPWRTFLVWAPNADRARRRVIMRYSDAEGFGVGPATERADFPAPAS